MRFCLTIIFLCLAIGTAHAAESQVVLKEGTHAFGPVSMTQNESRVVVGFTRVTWPTAARVRIEIYLTVDGVRGTEPICAVTTQGGASLAGGSGESSIDCPIPGQKTTGRSLDAIVIVTGATITTQFKAAIR